MSNHIGRGVISTVPELQCQFSVSLPVGELLEVAESKFELKTLR